MFIRWLRNDERGQQLLERGTARYFDLYGGNWILSEGRWVYIDP